MSTLSYEARRGELQTYFDRTAVEAWSRLTSEAPVGRIRATVRAGREQMRNTLLDWLPGDLTGKRLLDAGCGTGTLAAAAAQRGARVVAIDLSPKLVGLARERLASQTQGNAIDFRVGDFLDPSLGEFDYVVAMDSLIHYDDTDMVRVLADLASRAHAAVCCTFAPRTPLLAAMHTVGRWFPHSDRSPSLTPVALTRLQELMQAEAKLADWRIDKTERISKGFYISQALGLLKA